jgi:hypothetical protein
MNYQRVSFAYQSKIKDCDKAGFEDEKRLKLNNSATFCFLGGTL